MKRLLAFLLSMLVFSNQAFAIAPTITQSGGSKSTITTTSGWEKSGTTVKLKTVTNDVAIGPATASAKLHVHETNDGSNNVAVIIHGNDRATPTNGDAANLDFYLDNDGGVGDLYARLRWIGTTLTNTLEDGRFQIFTPKGGTLRNVYDGGSSEIVLNNDGVDIDTRIEANSISDAFFIQGSTGRQMLGGTDPDALLHLSHATTGSVIRLTTEDTDMALNEVIGKIEFEQSDTGNPGTPAYIQAIAEGLEGELGLAFATGTGNTATERVRIDEKGWAGFGTTDPSNELDVESNATTVEIEVTKTSAATSVLRSQIVLGSVGTTSNHAFAILANNTNRMTILPGGAIGVNDTGPDAKFEVSDSGDTRIRVTTTSAGNHYTGFELSDNDTFSGGMFLKQDEDQVEFWTGGANQRQIMTIDEGAEPVVMIGIDGTANDPHEVPFGRLGQQFEIGSEDNYGGMSLATFSTTVTHAPIIDLMKSANGTMEGNTLVANGEDLGWLIWRGADGTDFASAAAILGEVDGTPGNNDMPGRIVFYTSPDGTETGVEAVRIDSGQDTGFKETDPQRTVHINDFLRIDAVSAAPGSPAIGDIYVDSDSNELCFYDGSSWTGLKAAGACA